MQQAVLNDSDRDLLMKMQPLLLKACDRDIVIPPFAYDITVLRALFDAVNRLRVAEGDSPEERERIQEALPKFDTFEVIHVRVYGSRCGERRFIKLSMFHKGRFCNWLGSSDWDCRVSEDWNLISGISKWHVYDKLPLINPAQIKWQEVVRWVKYVRPYAWHWFEEHQKSTCAAGARGRIRDRAAFEDDFNE